MNNKYENHIAIISKLLKIYDDRKKIIAEIEVDQFLEIAFNHKLSEGDAILKD